MLKFLSGSLLLFLFTFPIKGQDIHVRHYKGVEFNVAKAKYGIMGGVGVSMFLNPKLYAKVIGAAELGSYKGFKRSTYFIEPALYALLFSPNVKTYINGLAGATLVMDHLGGFEGLEKKSFFSYGAVVGVEGEYYISNHVALLANFKYRFLIPGEYHFYYLGGLGIKFIL